MEDALGRTSVDRRSVLRWGIAGGVVAGAPWLLGACGTSGSQPSGTAATIDEGPPRRGGTLRIGVTGGGPTDTLDPHTLISAVDVLRTYALYDSLAEVADDRTIRMALAEQIIPANDGRSWTIRLKPGLQFHDGAPVTADAVVFTIQRIIDPAAPKNGALGFKHIDPAAIQKIDDLTVIVGLTQPNFLLLEQFAGYSNAIVPEDFDPAQPVGTGPFAFGAFSPGEQSVFPRNDSYWRDPAQPYVDELIVNEFSDDTALVNALVSSSVNTALGVPPSQLLSLDANPAINTVNRPSGTWFPFTMRVDQAPFDDVRVRQAMRLIVDRQQMIDQVYSGEARMGNDLFSPGDAVFAASLPQRTQDIERAKALLTEAGHENLEVELVTSELVTGLVEAAQVLAEQAKEAGVTINVRKVEPVTFFTQDYLNVAFAQDIWDERSFFAQSGIALVPGTPFNPTHWDDPTFLGLLEQAEAEPDADRRADLALQMQQILHAEGSYIVWSFPNDISAYSSKVRGVEAREQPAPLYEIWLAP